MVKKFLRLVEVWPNLLQENEGSTQSNDFNTVINLTNYNQQSITFHVSSKRNFKLYSCSYMYCMHAVRCD